MWLQFVLVITTCWDQAFLSILKILSSVFKLCETIKPVLFWSFLWCLDMSVSVRYVRHGLNFEPFVKCLKVFLAHSLLNPAGSITLYSTSKTVNTLLQMTIIVIIFMYT